jgi:hypothetical protein
MCVTPTHEHDILICKISKTISIPPSKVGMGLLAHSLETNLNFCQFTPTNNYKNFMSLSTKDAEVMKARNWFISNFGNTNSAPPGFNGNKTLHCQKTLQVMGPSSGKNAFYYIK